MPALGNVLMAMILAIGAVSAVPTNKAPSTPSYKAVSYIDTYDSASQLVKGLTPELPSSFVNGTAGGALFYKAFSFTYGGASQATLKNPSGTGEISFGVVVELAQGQPAWYPLNSTIVYFDQKSIYFACVANTGTAIGVPVSCTIQVTGTKYITGTTVVQELVYDPSPLIAGNSFTKGVFASTFQGLTKINIQLVQATTPQTISAILFDSNEYVAYYKK